MAGHIPHAVLDAGRGLLQRRQDVQVARGDPPHGGATSASAPTRRSTAHCGGGGAAAVPYFALKHLAGHPKVKLSVESQMGWLQDDRALPFWTYAAPGDDARRRLAARRGAAR